MITVEAYEVETSLGEKAANGPIFGVRFRDEVTGETGNYVQAPPGGAAMRDGKIVMLTDSPTWKDPAA